MFDFDFTDQWDVDKASDLLTSSLFGTSRVGNLDKLLLLSNIILIKSHKLLN